MKTEHCTETKDLLRKYRTALWNIEFNGNEFDEEKMVKLNLNVEEMREAFNASLEIKSKLEIALYRLQATHVKGYKLYRILYYRYLSLRHDISCTSDVLRALRQEDIILTESQYYRCLAEAENVISHFLFGDEYTYPKIAYSKP